MSESLARGTVVWVDLDPARGNEQAGRRPAVIIASKGYLANVPALAIVVPVTTRDRGWPHHVRLAGASLGLTRESYAMTEQPRTVARSSIHGTAGAVDVDTLAEVDRWLRDFIDI